MKAIFMGTPQFAVASLETLVQSPFEVALVISQPDRPKGRGKQVQMTPVKEKALELGLEVYQPEKIKTTEAIAKIKELAPDIIIVTAYGQILPKEILEIPPLGCINVHASLLPAYRGAAPINYVIIQGEKITGITTMYMSEGLDTGDMIDRDSLIIPEEVTAGELHDQLMELSKATLARTLESVAKGEIKREIQKDDQSSYAPMMNKELGAIAWYRSSKDIYNLIRGTQPWPAAHTIYREQVMKVLGARVLDKESSHCPGTIENVTSDGIEVATGDGILAITEIQMPGKKKMTVSEYLKGNNILSGVKLK